jgi:hypothetical protein
MVWDDAFDAATDSAHSEEVELVGTNLRMTGKVSLGRFNRLTDLSPAPPPGSSSRRSATAAGSRPARRANS